MKSVSRRGFLKSAGALTAASSVLTKIAAQTTDRPNILWITTEDHSPFLGCYGDTAANTPNMDALAAEGVTYDNFCSTMPQCAPARCSIITGMYATSLGRAQNMRSIRGGSLPYSWKAFPYYLRQAGYYCTNNDKTDYNININMGETWDANGSSASYVNRPAGSNFFAVFNIFDSHESQLSWRTAQVDPNAIDLPPYQPDHPDVRRDYAKYYAAVTSADAKVGQHLATLQSNGLADDTIVFFYSDHGGVLPRSKRFVYDSGIQAALIIRFPEKWAHLAPSAPGTRCDELCSFVDLAPTVLSLAGVTAPDNFQGRAFLGADKGTEPEYIYAFRSRSGERHDIIRAVRSKNYKYIRNFLPRIHNYMKVSYAWDNVACYQTIEQLHRTGQLTGPAASYWCVKPPDELYDLTNDPHEVDNLANNPAYASVLSEMSAAMDAWLIGSRDLGFVPEMCLWPGHNLDQAQDDATYPIARIVECANLVRWRDPANVPQFLTYMDDSCDTVRWWAIQGCIELGPDAAAAQSKLETLLSDGEAMIKLAAAHALAKMGQTGQALPVIQAIFSLPDNTSEKVWKLYAIETLQDLREDGTSIAGSITTPEVLTQKAADYYNYCRTNGFPPLCDHVQNTRPAATPQRSPLPHQKGEKFDIRGRKIPGVHRGHRSLPGTRAMTSTGMVVSR